MDKPMTLSPDDRPRARLDRFFDVGVVGRRTGITIKRNVKKDADGLDNIDDFWDDTSRDMDQEHSRTTDADQSPFMQDAAEYTPTTRIYELDAIEVARRLPSQPHLKAEYIDQDYREELFAASRRPYFVPHSNTISGSQPARDTSSRYRGSCSRMSSSGFLQDPTVDRISYPSLHTHKLGFPQDSYSVETKQDECQSRSPSNLYKTDTARVTPLSAHVPTRMLRSPPLNPSSTRQFTAGLETSKPTPISSHTTINRVSLSSIPVTTSRPTLGRTQADGHASPPIARRRPFDLGRRIAPEIMSPKSDESLDLGDFADMKDENSISPPHDTPSHPSHRLSMSETPQQFRKQAPATQPLQASICAAYTREYAGKVAQGVMHAYSHERAGYIVGKRQKSPPTAEIYEFSDEEQPRSVDFAQDCVDELYDDDPGMPQQGEESEDVDLEDDKEGSLIGRWNTRVRTPSEIAVDAEDSEGVEDVIDIEDVEDIMDILPVDTVTQQEPGRSSHTATPNTTEHLTSRMPREAASSHKSLKYDNPGPNAAPSEVEIASLRKLLGKGVKAPVFESYNANTPSQSNNAKKKWRQDSHDQDQQTKPRPQLAKELSNDKLAAKESKRVQRPAMVTSVPDTASNVRRGSNTELTYEVPTVLQEKLSTEENSGVRRSRRTVFKPLEFWKGEKLVFGKSDSTPVPVPVVKAVVHAVPKAEVDRKLQRKGRRCARPSKSTGTSNAKGISSRKRRLQVSDLDSSAVECEVSDSQSDQRISSSELAGLGAGQDVPDEAEVVDHVTGNIAKRVLAEAHDKVQYQDAPSGEYQFHRGLEDDDTISTGIVRIPAGGVKPNKNAFVSSVVFYIIKGVVQVTIYKSTITLLPGGRFIVPRGNQYMIKNLSKKESLLFFAQSKAAVVATESVSPKSESGSMDPTVATSDIQDNSSNHAPKRRAPANASGLPRQMEQKPRQTEQKIRDEDEDEDVIVRSTINTRARRRRRLDD